MILGDKSCGGSSWSRDDDIAFEKALAIYTDETENRWEKIAGVVPGKTSQQVIEHYEILLQDVMMIESGKVHLPDYDFSEETNDKEKSILECGIDHTGEHKQEFKPKLKQTRRKGIAWTADEHSQFLLGLDKYGKGDWRSISRNFVVTRTPTQVASHAQKYFARLNSRNKNKKRSSIHDVNVGESSNSSSMQGPTTWQNAQATSQPPSQDHHYTYGTPTIWNTQAVSQPLVNIPIYGMPIVGQSMAGPMVLPFGSDMNCLAPPHMAYGVQHRSIPYSFVLGAPFNICPVPYNMTYLPTSR